MINNVILVGRLADDPKLKTFDDGMNVCNITLAVTRPFKDMNTGEYGVDFINVSLWNGISTVAHQYTQKGDIIGVKGRISAKCKEVNGVNNYYLEVIGERIAFISLKNAKDGLKLSDEVIDNLNDLEKEEIKSSNKKEK